MKAGVIAMVALSAIGLIAVPGPAEAAVAAGTFTLSASPKSIALKPAGVRTVRISVKRGKGFKAPLSFQVQNPMAGVVATTSKATAAGTKLTVRADTTVPAQSGQIVVTATGGGKSQSVTLSVTTAGGAVAAAPVPAPVTVAATTPPTPAPPTPAPAPPTPAPTPPTVPPTAPPAPTTVAPAAPPSTGPAKFLLVPDKQKYYGSPSGQVDMRVTVTPEPGRTLSQVSMSLSGLPAGATYTPPQGGSTSTFTDFRISLPANTPLQTFLVTVVSVKNGVRVTAPVLVEVL